mgnify:CR=1 FL=1
MSCDLQYRLQSQKRLRILAAGGVGVVLLALADLMTGSSGMKLAAVLQALLQGPEAGTAEAVIVWSIRLPMTLTAFFVGAALSLAGLQIQNITGNALASPSTLGISSAAGFGAAGAITVGFTIFGMLWLGTALAAFSMAIIVSAAIYWLGGRRGMSPSTVILAGILMIVMNFFFMALQQFLQYHASPEVAQLISGWTFGNLERSTWTSTATSAAAVIAAAAYLIGRSWELTTLTIGEERALSLGVPVRRLRVVAFGISALLIACSVCFIGTVSFVGLVAPHLAKLTLGEDQRYLLPGSLLTGAMLMLASSVAAKLLSAGAVLPVGIVTSLVGVPFLLVLLLRSTQARYA